MGTKHQLEHLLSARPAATPVLRRGQGMTLSTEPFGAPATAQPAAATPPEKPTTPTRVNRGYRLRDDLIRACKRLAFEQERHLCEVMEEALAEYLERHAPDQAGAKSTTSR